MRIVMAVSIAATAVSAPTAGFAVDYLTADQAAQSIFPDADHFDSKPVNLDAGQLAKLDSLGIRARSAQWTVKSAQRGATPLGYVIVDDVVGKFELITYAVGIGLDGAVKQVEILSYRESHGQEIRLAAWRRQFVGKTVASALRNGDDIANISGATLSCSHVTEGVKRIVAVVDLVRRSGALS